ncbi:MAG: MFS transporter [Alphaproteobacteria bacterium]|nr:MFS transporter [Alphaproteobacteria bacterium]
MTAATTAEAPKRNSRELLVVGASSLGAMFEWYDFFLYGSLAAYIGRHFFSNVNETTGFIFALAAFASGFIVRPLGALVFGRVGDIVGRKNTFLVTMGVMGLSTFVVGLLPGYDAIGIAAPIILVGLRLLQGLAIGGEYGGAAIYVAEHARADRRGLNTSWIQTTAAYGLLLSLAIIMGARATIAPDQFAAWGWRIPFLLSIILLAVSIWIRMKLNESPVFQKMKSEMATSKAPYVESFLKWPNLKIVLIALLGCVAGQAVTFYTGTFYVLFFLERLVKVDPFTTNLIMAAVLVIGSPIYVFFGWLSDRMGRKRIIMAGLLLAALTYFPAFKAMTAAANPGLAHAQATVPVAVYANKADCSFQFDLIGRNKFEARACDVVKAYLARESVNYETKPREAGAPVRLEIGDQMLVAPDAAAMDAKERAAAIDAFRAQIRGALTAVGYPEKADPRSVDTPRIIAIALWLMLVTTMCYGPMAAMLVELFPARIRYTSMSAPYHIGNGWFGGLMPTTAFAITAATGDIYAGLWYPVIIAAMSFVIGLLFLPETRGRPVEHV